MRSTRTPEENTTIEAFLNEVFEQGDGHLQHAAGQLLAYFRGQSYAALREIVTPAIRVEKMMWKALDELTDYLQEARKDGYGAWEGVQEKVNQFIGRFPGFQTQLPVHYAGLFYTPPDRSWSVFVKTQASTRSYHIVVEPPKA